MANTIRVKLEDASRDQLLYFANKVKGLGVSPNTPGTASIIKKIKLVHKEEEIELPAPGAARSMAGTPPQANHPNAAKGKGKGGAVPLVTLILAKHEKDPSGSRDLELVFQNRAFLVPRGKPVRIPWYYFEILRNCIRDHCQPQKDDNGNFLMGAGPLVTQMQEHPFNIVEMPPKATLLAYLVSIGARWDEGLDVFYAGQSVMEPVAA